MKMRNFSVKTKKLLVQAQLNSKNVHGCRQAYCAVRLIRSPTPKATSSPTLCCVGKIGDDPLATWKSKMKWYSENNHFKGMNRIDGMPTEFEWTLFAGITALGFLEKIQKLMNCIQCEPEHFNGRIIFMTMSNHIVWGAKGNKEHCEYNSQAVAEYARKFPRGRWSFLGLDQKKNGTEHTLTNQMDPGIEWQNKCWQISLDPVIRYFVPPVLLQREKDVNTLQW